VLDILNMSALEKSIIDYKEQKKEIIIIIDKERQGEYVCRRRLMIDTRLRTR